MAEKPSEAFARRMKLARERRNWTQENLAEELSTIGWTVDRAQIAKIETGTRKVSLDEAITIAWALSVPPAFLYLPLGEADDVKIENQNIHPDLARKWVTGQLPAVTSEQHVRLPGAWKADMAVWWLHDKLHEAQEAERQSGTVLRSAQYAGDAERIEQSKRARAEALLNLAEALEEIRAHGLRPPAIHQETADEFRQVGIAYTGPVYPGPGVGS